MARSFSKELREKVVTAYKNGVGTIAKTAEIFGMAKRTVSKYLAIDRECGDLTPGKRTGRPPLLTAENLGIIKAIVLATPDDRLQDYCTEFKLRTGLSISKSCLWDACKILNLRRKKKLFCPRTNTS